MNRLAFLSSCLLLICCLDLLAAEKPLSFNRDIKPILSTRCFACHGFDKAERKADLRLDSGEEAHKSGVLQPNKKGEIAILARITSADPDEQMPPAFSKKPLLSPEEIAKIKRWVAEGAKYDTHWAFVPPQKAAVPVLQNSVWPVNEIDHFVGAEQEARGLKASAAADKRTLLRRLSFDLTGLPPTPEEVTSFATNAAPEAYEQAVDRLLESPHYGERMAMYWLDVVRYADTAGYHSDNPRNVAPYRDYVIQAFNTNLPFDQFTREQLAGDLLPNATVQQKVASTYNRLLQTTEEGGAQAKEYTAKYAADRVRNFSVTWMALSMGCCECHDHKFDPLTIKDFYSMQAYFADIQEAAVGRREPGMPVPNAEHEKQLAELQATIATAQAELQSAAEKAADQPAPADLLSSLEAKWELAKATSQHVKGESKLNVQDDGSLKSSYKVAAQETYVIEFTPASEKIAGLRLEAITDSELPAQGPGTAPNGNFVLTNVKLMLVDNGGKEKPLKIEKAVADHAQAGHDISTSFDNNLDGTGWAILPQTGQSHEAIYQFAETEIKEGAKLKVILDFRSQYPQHNIGRLRFSTTAQGKAAEHYIHEDIRKFLTTAPAERKPADRAKVVAFFQNLSTTLQPQRDRIQTLNNQRTTLEESIPKTLISISGAPRTVRILARGNWLDDSGEIVTPATPGVLGLANPATDQRPTRLDLANWLLDPQHPLTSRAFVNRVWKLLFSRGLVKSADDFGMQGEYPSHAELLDYLAVDFREHHWNVKRLVKQIVMSHSYRQASLVSAESREKDPPNIWLAHQARFRLEAEFVRDNALAVSGLLVRKIGGPSVKPYQPAGYWSYLNFPAREWQNDKGEGLYRRGLYTHWQRTFPHPSLVAFDAPSREECTVDRARSNTPLQSLVLLNDPTYVESARALAAKTIAAGSESPVRLAFMFRQVLQREPRAEEMQTLQALLEKHAQEFASDAKTSQELFTVGDTLPPANLANPAELAAWTSVARVLLNLHETITRN